MSQIFGTTTSKYEQKIAKKKKFNLSNFELLQLARCFTPLQTQKNQKNFTSNRDEIPNTNFRDDGKFTTWRIVNLEIINISNLSVPSAMVSRLESAMYLLWCNAYCLCNTPPKIILACNRCWILLWKYCLSVPDIRIHFSVNTMHKI